jgi:3-oxoacyl-[acyl-carrier-protein] synthase-3
MADASELIMKRNNLTNQDVDWLVPHQANKRDATASRMNLEESKVLMNIEKYGNTTSATLPLVLYDFEHLFKRRYNYSGCFWRRFHVGFCLFKMGVRQKIIVN